MVDRLASPLGDDPVDRQDRRCASHGSPATRGRRTVARVSARRCAGTRRGLSAHDETGAPGVRASVLRGAEMSARSVWLRVLKHTIKPLAIGAARRGSGPFSLVEHVGRKSGARYETPIIVAPV